MRERVRPKKNAYEVRPIPARLLKSLGDSLRPYLSESEVIDLYAGTGAMGLKLLMEGATHCEFVEIDHALCRSIELSLHKHSLPGTVHCQTVEDFLNDHQKLYDVVLADPPFPLWEQDDFHAEFPVKAARLVKKSGLLVMKVPSGWLPPTSICDLNRKKSSAVGDSQLVYYEARLGD